MKVTIIHGQSHKGSTYHISKILADKLLRLWDADPAQVLATEQAHDFSDI